VCSGSDIPLLCFPRAARITHLPPPPRHQPILAKAELIPLARVLPELLPLLLQVAPPHDAHGDAPGGEGVHEGLHGGGYGGTGDGQGAVDVEEGQDLWHAEKKKNTGEKKTHTTQRGILRGLIRR